MAAVGGASTAFMSQSGEDKWAWAHLFYGRSNGTFIEMGALDGKKYSNTW